MKSTAIRKEYRKALTQVRADLIYPLYKPDLSPYYARAYKQHIRNINRPDALALRQGAFSPSYKTRHQLYPIRFIEPNIPG